MYMIFETALPPSNQIGFIGDNFNFQHGPMPQDYFQNELHHKHKKTNFINFFGQTIQESPTRSPDATTQGQAIRESQF
ncbi:hypothetical protein PCASD_17531 [Puccinia coronata f. sp. avenae]|uniref:Uncharacterized protein n=1 Tax=Puccinia coronata f. sp. avenae TaxID=200324 RepID=A0A2N5U3U5_9BASI|nr:hypothetical protein PCASD_17531 [Puccinia coronata f. sp. avenae]